MFDSYFRDCVFLHHCFVHFRQQNIPSKSIEEPSFVQTPSFWTLNLFVPLGFGAWTCSHPFKKSHPFKRMIGFRDNRYI